MEYTPTTWKTNDVITRDKLNKVEQGLAAASLPKQLVVANAYRSGASWYRTDPAKPAWMVQVDSISDLCQIRRAPPGAGAIEWIDVCQADSGGLRPRICVPSDELRYTGSPGGTGGSGWIEAATLISKRVPLGAPYYGAGHYQMGIRIRATLTSSTYRPDVQGTTITFTLYVDGVEKASASASHGNPGYMVADVQVNPYSLIEIRTPRFSAHNSPVYVNVSEFTISATDVNAQATGW